MEEYKLSTKTLKYLISEDKDIALYCKDCKIYYIINSKNYQGSGPDICDKCYQKFMNEIYFLYGYKNTKSSESGSIENKQNSYKQKQNFFYKIKKLINNFLY